ncbi:hypothetical protein ALC56_03236 [Trachymyrmex septentrionalis]|uniref:Uncharacterized protein n=1 Tax=Trachymyrmex septentrionalis TaxID=34720 RepID=A0A195FNR7_9HYME|nr:hypothetical protein ALC56_03236 [Trachymyrmex septentrionalis]
MTTHGAPTNEENSSRVYVHSWLSATHTSSNKARLFIKRTNSILPLLVNEVIFESDFGDPVKDVTSSGNKPSRKEVLDAKRARLRQLFKSDAIDLDNSFRELGYAFIPTQP